MPIRRGPQAIRRCVECPRLHQGGYDLALAEMNRMSTPGHAGRLKAPVFAQLGDPERASEQAAAYMAIVPTFRLAKRALTWRYANPSELDRYMDGLRKAGFPE